MSAAHTLIEYYRTQFRLLWSWRGAPGRTIRRVLLSIVMTIIALLVTAALMPGLTITNLGNLIAAAIILGLLNLLVRPIFIGLVSGISVVAVAIVALIFQVLVFIVIANGCRVSRSTGSGRRSGPPGSSPSSTRSSRHSSPSTRTTPSTGPSSDSWPPAVPT